MYNNDDNVTWTDADRERFIREVNRYLDENPEVVARLNRGEHPFPDGLPGGPPIPLFPQDDLPRL